MAVAIKKKKKVLNNNNKNDIIDIFYVKARRGEWVSETRNKSLTRA